MKAYYVLSKNEDFGAIVIPKTGQFWNDPTEADINLFRSGCTQFAEWENHSQRYPDVENHFAATEESVNAIENYLNENFYSGNVSVVAYRDDAEKSALLVHTGAFWNSVVDKVG